MDTPFFGRETHALRGILEGMRAGVSVTDAEGRYVFVNAGYCGLFGYSAGELIGRHFSLVLPADSRPEALNLHHGVVAGTVEMGGEWTVLRKDGRRFNVEAQAGLYEDPDGQRFRVTTVVDTSRRKAVEEALRASQARLAEAQRLANLGHWEVDLKSGRLSCSEQVRGILGLAPGQAPPTRAAILDMVHPDDRAALEAAQSRALEGHGGYTRTFRLTPPGATTPRLLRERGEVARWPDGRPRRLFGSLMDITREHQREAELKKLSQVVEQNSAIILITDPDGIVEYANPRLTEVTGFPLSEVIGQTPRLFRSGLTPPETYREMWRALKDGGEWRGELLNTRRDGSLYWERAHLFPLHGVNGEITHFVAIKEDISAQKAAEAELRRALTLDPLTGLPNRRAAFDQVAERIAAGPREGARFALILVNLDGFSRLIQAFGHRRGDAVLKEVARRLGRAVSADCWLLARIGGDRFCLAVENFAATAQVELTARAVLDAVAEPFDVDGQPCRLTATLGIALYPADGASVDLLVRNAETAVRQAQARGPGSYRFFLKERGSGRSLGVESDLAGALTRGELWLAYQPIVQAQGVGHGAWAGLEALIRWQHPRLGAISPGEFVPLFEGTDLAHEIGGWVLARAMDDITTLRRQTGLDLFVSVNVSPRQLRRAEFAERVAELLAETGLPPGRLDLEITERLFVEHRPEVMAVLEVLNEFGTAISLDDFGTGYSALGTLLELPMRVLKIDRQFVAKATDHSRERHLIEAVITMCRNLSILTVAEGVETPAQARTLAELGADLLQGYLFSRPLPLAELIELVGPACRVGEGGR
ncbi:sensor domain-containing protein [Roseospirillum parvum]|uniref:PAS domain S-box-containing protein/diguanylate cyclase (GGDEF) domain-containing protein n=1 Tax=Roseospirillum parvum TaxID=83401 RepID=A0A1G8DJ50_9PROT|nr:bifunctional diguanylate cyclase/phosphodiesterase [Roseospirillum parvum]SDH57420.1 PAS domain S-box-containing protein/diguanylate cyclase (GGDEF) domain-containing protein [Roseospirillum parvum]